MTADALPPINATLNGASTLLLIAGYVLIKQGNWRAHAAVMLSALVTSSAFLVCYLIHKAVSGERSIGLEPGPLKYFYLFVILLPHVVLAVGMLPMILLTVYHAYRRRWDKHRRLAKPTFWIWLYVSVTGVIIYWMLYHLFPTMPAR